MKKSRIIALAVFVVCLGLAFFIAREGDQDRAETPTTAGPDVVFPREDFRRPLPKRARQKPVARDAPLDVARAQRDRRKGPDPLEAAVAVGGDKGAVFVEVNALQETPLVKKMLRCRGQDAEGALQRIQEKIGLDPTRDIDRVALTDGVVAASGFFDNLTMPSELGEGTPLGDDATLYEIKDDNGEMLHVARLSNDMLLFGNSEKQVKDAVGRVRGEVPVPATSLPVSGAMGDVYGRMSGPFIAGLLATSQNPMAQRAAELIQDGMVRATVGEHVAMSMDFSATDEASAEDLSRTLGGLIAAGRLQAVQENDKVLERLLEKARVKPTDGGRFELDLALPGDLMLDAMGCDADGTPKGGDPPPDPAAARPDPAPPEATDDEPAPE